MHLHWWGTWLIANSDHKSHDATTKDRRPGPLTVEEFLALDWNAIRVRYPELKGAWIYADKKSFKEVMIQLGQAARRD